jgi:hypothetical protein
MARAAAVLGTAQTARFALEAAFLALEPGWTIRAGLRLGEPPAQAAADYLLLHPRKGIALVDVGAGCGEVCAALQHFLERDGFASFFPGMLPIVHVAAAAASPTALAERLDAAFAAAPGLTIAEPDWAAALRLLVAAEPDAAPRRGVEPARGPRRWAAGAAVVAMLSGLGMWMAFDRPSPRGAALELALPPAAKTKDRVAATPALTPPAAAAAGGVAPYQPAPAPPPLPARKPLLLRAIVARPTAAALARRRCQPASAAVTGMACQARDGSWRLVSEAPRQEARPQALRALRDSSDSAAARPALP